MKSVQMVDYINGTQHAPQQQVSTAVTDSWKFAAVEICNMLHKVRDNGTADLQMLDQKIQELVYTMNQQTEMIEQLNGDLHQQKELLKFSELTTTKLSSDNCLLKDELEMTRGQLVTAKKTLASLETQLETTKLETVGKEESEGRTRVQGEVSYLLWLCVLAEWEVNCVLKSTFILYA